MILMGDEVRRTQQGNNNAYCQDNETSWLDWTLVTRHADLSRYVRALGAFRLMRGVDPDYQTLTLNEILRDANGVWHGVKLREPDWRFDSHSVAYSAARRDGSSLFYAIFNAYWEELEFELPPATPQAPWRCWVDTSLDSPHDIVEWENAPPVTTPPIKPNRARLLSSAGMRDPLKQGTEGALSFQSRPANAPMRSRSGLRNRRLNRNRCPDCSTTSWSPPSLSSSL
jgi:hypothetical protein